MASSPFSIFDFFFFDLIFKVLNFFIAHIINVQFIVHYNINEDGDLNESSKLFKP